MSEPDGPAEQLLAGSADPSLIADRYRILEKLGEGGMGAVYRAHDTHLDRDVAVKVLPAHSLADADAVARFQREARALARLSHPNVIQAYDNGQDHGRQFLVMEYVAGVSLAAILRERGAIPPTLAADMIYQAALGLQHAHEKGLVHRDLKPANLLLSTATILPALAPSPRPAARPTDITASYIAPAALHKGIVRILDLGLARFLQDQLGDSQLTREGAGVGTPDYMAPEQFRDALHADARTDIYGLGCTLYHLISGTVPFPGSSFSEKADAHAKREPIPLEERCPEVPAGLALVVSKMMAKHPADRFQTAAETAEALAPFVAGASHSMVMLRQTVRFHAGQLTVHHDRNRRKRLAVWAGGALAAACFAGLILFGWPGIFPRGSGAVPNRSETNSPTAPLTAATKPDVITIENGVTVAKDGTGQFTTIGAALQKVSRGMTIRIVDDAVYPEAVQIVNPAAQEGLTLEAPRRATVQPPPGAKVGVVVLNVPHVTVRGLTICVNSTGIVAAGATGYCPGVIFDDLRCESATQLQTTGIIVDNLRLGAADAPAVVKNTRIVGFGNGFELLGLQVATNTPYPCSRILLRDNRAENCSVGVWVAGRINFLHVFGNVMSGQEASIRLASLIDGSGHLLIANNSMIAKQNPLEIIRSDTGVDDVHIRNNVIVCDNGPDMVRLQAEKPLPSNSTVAVMSIV